MSTLDRRQFLRIASALSPMGIATPMALNLAALGAASAQTTASDYKALVCIFLYGGNDAYNTVLANDATSWSAYNTVRDPRVRNPSSTGDSIALLAAGTASDPSKAWGTNERLGGILSIANPNRLSLNNGRQFALHPVLGGIQQLYASGRVAIVPNIGPLIAPTSKSQFASPSHPKPAKLFSHNDQQSTWQSFSPEGATAGWGGRLADLLMSANTNSSFTSIGVGGGSVWLSGQTALQYQINATGLYRMGSRAGTIFGSAAPYQAMLDIVKQTGRNSMLARDYVAVNTRSLDTENTLQAALPLMFQAPWGTPTSTAQNLDPKLQYVNPNNGTSTVNPLAVQLQAVARMIAARKASGIGARRQVFMVGMSSFDTHSNQLKAHADLLAKLNHAVAYFDTVLSAMPEGDMRSSVTTFTASDFGRTFTNNNGGSDHGWGGHHFVMGGAVNGGDVYGHFPEYSINNASGVFSSPNQIVNGVMLPELSVEHLSYTLGKWMGVSDTDLVGTTASAGILPNLRTNFDSSGWSLKFMKA